MSTRNYEAMFILDNNASTADFEGTSAQVDAILEKHGATLVQKEKWDERKLAYEIKGQRRGTYYLTYFSADPASIRRINEDVQLNEVILRHLVIALERPIDEHIATLAEEREKLAEDSRKNAIGGWGGGRRGGDRDRERRPPRRKDDDSGDDESSAPEQAKSSESTEGASSSSESKPAEASAES